MCHTHISPGGFPPRAEGREAKEDKVVRNKRGKAGNKPFVIVKRCETDYHLPQVNIPADSWRHIGGCLLLHSGRDIC